MKVKVGDHVFSGPCWAIQGAHFRRASSGGLGGIGFNRRKKKKKCQKKVVIPSSERRE